MWRPDVVLLNTAGQMLNFQQKADFYANVNHNGDVYWAPSITTKSICEVCWNRSRGKGAKVVIRVKNVFRVSLPISRV